MALTQTSTTDQITIEANGIILVRTNNVIMDETTQVAQSYSRTSLVPGQDLTGQPVNVVDIANLTWTPDVIAAYKASIKSSLLTNNLGA